MAARKSVKKPAAPAAASAGRTPPAAASAGDTAVAAPRVVAHLTVAERRARGRAARTDAPRGSHAGWTPADTRRDPIAVLEEQGRVREQDLLPIRYGRMLASPFAFYRGAAAIMAADLATTPRSGLVVQACGDAHLLNFGVFAAPDRSLVFDVNDFDETCPAPWEWDVKRLAASLEVAGRDLGTNGKVRRRAVLAAVRTYRDAMTAFAGQRELEIWYARLDPQRVVDAWRTSDARDTVSAKKRAAADQAADGTERLLEKAREKDSLRALSRLTETVDGQVRIVSRPPLLVPLRELVSADALGEEVAALHKVFRVYRSSLPADRRHLLENFRIVDLARKVVGVGSVGTRCWIGLLFGRDEDDPLFLQFKEADESVLEPFAGSSRFANHGRRVVEGQRLMQAAGDIMLGWTRITGTDGVKRDFYVRQLWDEKGSVDPSTATPQALEIYASMCAWTLARAHARSGDRIAIAAYLGSGDVFPQAIAAFSAAYADQNERDHAALEAAVKVGRLSAQTGV